MRKIYLKINQIISSDRKNQLLGLIFLLIIGMFLEVFGLGIILPVLNFIANKEIIQSYPGIHNFLFSIGFKSYDQIAIFLLVFLAFIYAVKTFFLLILNYFKNRFIFSTTRDLYNNLFYNYISQSYERFIKKNSSDYIKVLQLETENFGVYLTGIITLIVEIALSFSVLLVLIYVNPIGAITLLLFFLPISYAFYFFSKGRIKIWGKKREELDRSVSKIIHEGFDSFREIKIFNSRDYFLKKLESKNFEKTKIRYNQTTLLEAPRFFLELILVVALVIFVLTMILQNEDLGKIISTLGVFAAGSFRIIPSLNRIITARQHIKYYDVVIDLIREELIEKKGEHKEVLDKINFNENILLSNLSFKYNVVGNNILNKINLEIYKGELIGIVGESGFGKSTLVDLISGLLKPNEGVISIDRKVIEFGMYNYKDFIGYVSQKTNLIDDTILANVAFGDLNPDLEKIKKALHDSQILDFVNSLPEGFNTKIGERGVNLSGGQIQRISIARSLYRNPEILIFDEATSSLDNKTEAKLINSIYKLKGKITIIMIAHRLSSLKKCDRIYELKNSKFMELKKKVLNF